MRTHLHTRNRIQSECIGIRTGHAHDTLGSNFPDHVFPSIVGRPILRTEERDAISATGIEVKDLMVGEEAEAVRTYLQVTQPMEHGIVKDFEEMRHGTYGWKQHEKHSDTCTLARARQFGTTHSTRSSALTHAGARSY